MIMQKKFKKGGFSKRNSGQRRGSGNQQRRFGGGGGGYQQRSSGGFQGSTGPREMHKTTCAECKQECEVPFKPTEGKPVYCRDCYQKRRRF